MFQKMLFLMLALIIYLGCNYNDTTSAPESPINMPPVIDELLLPESVEAGAETHLQVVKHDPENDALTVNWRVSEGSLDTINEIWTAPKHETTVEITVFVSDGSNKAVSTMGSVQVISMPTLPTPDDQGNQGENTGPNNVVVNPLNGVVEVGDCVIVTNTGVKRLRIRNPPGVDQDIENIIGSAGDGATGTVIDGPMLGDGFAWWQIEWDANEKVGFNPGEPCCIGWSAEETLDGIRLLTEDQCR